MKTLLSYQERGNFGNPYYRGNFSGKLLLDLHKVYKFNSISDYSCGSNTTGDFAKALNLRAATYDLNMGFDLIDENITERNEFIIYHPAYWDIIKYSGFVYNKGMAPHKHDLSNIPDYKDFIRAFDYTVAKQFSSLKTGGRMAIVMADVKKNRKLYSMFCDMAKPGTLEQIIIKEQCNCRSDSKVYAHEDSFFKIAHEYVLILRKDNPYLFNIMLVDNKSMDIRNDNFRDYKTTWLDLVAAAFENLKKKFLHLSDIYKELEGHEKTKNNENWKAKVRQVVQLHPNLFINENKGEGYWRYAA